MTVSSRITPEIAARRTMKYAFALLERQAGYNRQDLQQLANAGDETAISIINSVEQMAQESADQIKEINNGY